MIPRMTLLAVALIPAAAAQEGGLADTILTFLGPARSTEFTQQGRLKQYVLNTVGPVPLLGEAASAGIMQWRDVPLEWGQGWGAYAERYANNLGFNMVRQSIAYGTSIAMGEDDRYFASQADGVWPRTRHALVSTFTARHRNGHVGFSVSSVAGVVGANAIAFSWRPDSRRGVDHFAANVGISFAATAAFNVMREFLPDMLHRPRR